MYTMFFVWFLGIVLFTGQSTPRVQSHPPAAQRRDIRGIDLEEVVFGNLVPRHFNGSFISGKLQKPFQKILEGEPASLCGSVDKDFVYHACGHKSLSPD